MLKDYHWVYICLEAVIAVFAVSGNILVCWAVCLNSNLQSITNFFVVSLAVADIAVGLLAIPFAVIISTGFCADFHGCLFIACFVLMLTQSSIFSLLAIALDRYIAIKNPLRYSSVVTARRAKGIIAVCWFLSLGIGLIPILGWNTGINNTTDVNGSCPKGMTECLFEEVVPLDYMVYFNFFGCVLLPLVLMLIIYVKIFMAARRQLQLIELKVVSKPSFRDKTVFPSSSRTTLQREVHAAKSLSIIVGFFALCWLPLHLLNCFNHLCLFCNRPNIWVMNIAIILSHANSAVNPFIYAYRIQEFRVTFRRIFYQQILRQKDGHGFRVGSGDSRRGSSFARTSTCSSKEVCSTVVNNYIMEQSWDLTSEKGFCNSTFETLQRVIPSGGHIQGGALSKTQPCQVGPPAEEAECSGKRGRDDDTRDTVTCISFVNTKALTIAQTELANSTEVS
ncbi:adenosine A2a receptor b [Synchiropus splendidus]|uniref:adenosine A2a receptor b n=1 Tax=Synchiropus splendidus TaxID=270530 RepID=UPI00237D799B|nr:adenosine A2a receptor b [Synchiropus splendidus]